MKFYDIDPSSTFICDDIKEYIEDLYYNSDIISIAFELHFEKFGIKPEELLTEKAIDKIVSRIRREV